MTMSLVQPLSSIHKSEHGSGPPAVQVTTIAKETPEFRNDIGCPAVPESLALSGSGR